MTSGVLRAMPQDPGRRIGLLYFLNSFGAVVGVLASAFVLVPTVGLPGASLAAGLTNGPASALRLPDRPQPRSRHGPPQAVTRDTGRARRITAATTVGSVAHRAVLLRVRDCLDPHAVTGTCSSPTPSS